ncbi:hypothetical protein AB4P97_09280 [Pseudomonas sp. A1230]|uniref:hypothetical protein n=1 Tax=Pseudomonas sp. A1230 TaxID=3235106 RepID=UPI003783717F
MVNTPLSSKSFRILVADQQISQRSLIVRELTALGYFRIATASNFREMVTLTHYNPEATGRFDLLVVNAELIGKTGVDPRDFCLHNSRLRHVLIYEPKRKHYRSRTFSEHARQQLRLIRAIDGAELRDFLSTIDPDFEVARPHSG